MAGKLWLKDLFNCVFGGPSERMGMPATVAVLLLVLLAEAPPWLTSLPQEVVRAMAAVRTSPDDPGFKIPGAVPPAHVVRGDFDGNGYEDWAIIVETQRRTAILVAYGFKGEWRSGTVDVWGGPECKYCSRGSRPVGLTLLPPGSYERVSLRDGPLVVNERERIASDRHGVHVNLADDHQRAYYLVPHVWTFVELSPKR